MKKVILMLLALVMCFSCVCVHAEDAHEPVTLTIYADNATYGANEARLESFMKQYPWITVEMVELSSGSTDRVATLGTMLQAKDDSMDVYIVDCTWPQQFAAAGWLENLDDVFTEEELALYSQGALEGCKIDGKLVCFPFYLTTGAMFYRTDLLEKYGFSGPAQTWDELIEQCKVVMAGEPGLSGYAAAWQQAEALVCCGLEHVWGFGGDVVDAEGNPTFNTPEVKAGIESMKKILDSGVAIDGILGMKAADIRAAFWAGNVLYCRDWSINITSANNPDVSTVAGKVGLTTIPSDAPGENLYNCNGGWNLAISPFSKHKEEAKLLLRYWAGYESNLLGAVCKGDCPAYTAVFDDPEVEEKVPWMKDLRKYGEQTRNRPGSPYYEELSAAMQQAIMDVLMGADFDSTFANLQTIEEEIFSR